MDSSSLTSINKLPINLFRKCFISNDRGKKFKSSKNTSTWIFYSKYNENINKIIIELTISKISGNVLLLINNVDYTDKLFIDKKLIPDINNGIKKNYKLKYLNHILNFIIDISLLKTHHKLFIDGFDFFSLKIYDDYDISSNILKNNDDMSSDNSSDTKKDIVKMDNIKPIKTEKSDKKIDIVINDIKKDIVKMDNIKPLKIEKPDKKIDIVINDTKKNIVKMDNIKPIKPIKTENPDKKIDIYDIVFNTESNNTKSIITNDTFNIPDNLDKKTDIEKDLLLIFGPEKKSFNPFD